MVYTLIFSPANPGEPADGQRQT